MAKTQMYRNDVLSNTQVNLYPVTEAKYVTMNDGQTVEEMMSNLDTDKYTPVIESSKAMFKVGEGDSVDLSESAIDGAYNSCVLKGKTMVNCIQEPSSQDVVLPYEFEDGQYVTINDTKESGALGVELKGQTLVNIPTVKTYYASNKLTSEWVATFQESVDSVKTNTKYYIGIFNNSEETKSYGLRFNPFTVTSKITINPKSYGFLIGTTVSDINSTALIINASDHNLDNNVDILFIEYQDGMENWDIPYFIGMTSCKMPILHTVGKNLFNTNKQITSNATYEVIGDELILSCSSAGWYNLKLEFFNLTPNKPYTLSYDYEILEGSPNNQVIVVDSSNTTISNNIAPSDGKISIIFYCGNSTKFGKIRYYNIQLEEASAPTSYEPYKSSSLSLPEEVVLRSLPNGVCDTFNTRTGVYTQRVGAMVLNGSDPITSRMEQTDNVLTTTSRCYLDYASIPSDISMKPFSSANGVSNKLICDILPVKAVVPNMQQDDIESVGQTTAGFSIRVKGKTIAECRQRLAEQPVTIQYELATPIITKINLSSTLKSWNTTTHIYSEIPENTLYPILSHSNATYPVILKPSTKYSIVANSYSNNHTNSAINFNLGGATASTTVGSRVTTITTPSTLTSEELVMSGRGNKLNNVMVIEGDVAGDEPYFEGICDVKSPILSNVGKNLFDLNQALDVNNWAVYPNKPYRSIAFKVKPKTTYSLSCSANVNVGNGGHFGIFPRGGYYATEDGGWNTSLHWGQSSGVTKTTFTTLDQEVYYMSLYFYSGFTQDNVTNFFTNRVVDIQIEEVSTETAYEPYKSNTTTFNQKDDKTIVLRSLPNGTCDTLNVETGEYVQRIEEITFDGSNEQWEVLAHPPHSNNTHYQFKHYLGEGVIGGNLWTDARSILSNTLPSANDKLHWNGNGIYGIGGSSNYIIITWKKDTCPFNDVATLNEWLSQNPTTVQYELATPIVTTVDVQGFPYAYKDGHVQLSSGSIEQSLTPKVEYSLVANRNGQIEANTKMTIRHDKQINEFENVMLVSLLESSYQKTLMKFNFDMQMMNVGGEEQCQN